MTRRKGFTLVELLVVIAIIGLLSTIAFIALNQARGKARDAKRVSDIRQMQSALELYYNDQTSPRYPADGTVAAGTGKVIDSTILDSSYVAQVPVAPLPRDGTCATDAQNSYTYFALAAQAGGNCDNGAGGDCGWYRIDFCLGGATGNLAEGIRNAQPTGIQ